MRLPNGYGSVYKLSGNRRNPWVAAKTDGYDVIEKEEEKKLKRKYHIIGYYPTRAKALQALADFNDNPYDIELSKVTFAEIYQRWYNDEFNDESNASTKRNYESAYKQCTALYNLKMSDIKPNVLQKVVDDNGDSYNVKHRIKILLSKMYDWCIDHDAIKKNYAKRIKIDVKPEPSTRKRFSTYDIEKLWKHAHKSNTVAIVLILIYSGVRIMELLDLKIEDVNLDEQYFNVIDSKTTSGIRTVPIADKVLPFWKKFIDRSKCSYAICNAHGNRFTYDNFQRHYWKPLMQELNIEYTPHETRHTFISMATAKNVNPTIIKKIVGHKSLMSLTENVYTHPEIKELLDAVNLL